MTPEAGVLAQAFADDPLMTYFWPDANRRHRAMPYFWESRVESRRRNGIVDTVRDDTNDIVSVVLWDPPGVTSIAAKPGSLLRALGLAVPRVLATSRRMEHLRPKQPHLYLAAGASLPHAQGKSLVSDIIRARVANTDVDCFTVATNQTSRAIAEYGGFHLVAELPINKGPTVYGLLRPAGPPAPTATP
ncbi:hypothetical protein [Nocardia brasiliensis]|uniref:hypothetical protein n=1 Tax=Nocardia brasiliensis TaxID=37326 RepID=UPI0036736118